MVSSLKEAYFYRQYKDGKVECLLCPHRCIIGEGRVGICKVRKNIGGKLYSLNYGVISSAGIDPIEKKPLYHFYPTREIFSIGTFGCNFHCFFCQNWQISQDFFENNKVYAPEKIIPIASKDGSIGLAFTYNEPFIWYEFVYDTSILAKKEGLKTVLVTNGYINEEPLRKLIPYIDAANVDLKAFDDIFYEKQCGGHLAPVLKTIKTLHEAGVHVEVTNLIIPTLNDTKEHICYLAEWLAALSPTIPLHISRYYPNYKMDIPPASVENIVRIFQYAKRYLKYVYVGNIIDLENSSTYCPECGNLIIKRIGYNVEIINKEPLCKNCGYKIDIIW